MKNKGLSRKEFLKLTSFGSTGLTLGMSAKEARKSYCLPHVNKKEYLDSVSRNINPELLNKKWDAQWITHTKTAPKDFGIFHFRKKIQLQEIKEEFIIHLSADNRYRFFVNGKEVCKGPARGDLLHWRFETVDIAEYLQKGENILASVVWNFGQYSPLAQMSHRTAFIVQGNSKREKVVNTGNEWKVFENRAYSPPVEKPARTVVGPGEIVDGSKYPYGWKSADYDAAFWESPKTLGQGVPYGKFSAWDWMLVPRNIPLMEYKLQRIDKVERAENIRVNDQFLKGAKPLHIPSGTQVKILLDQTYLTTAYPELIVSKGKGSVIEINYAEALVDEDGVKGNRDKIEGKTPLSYYSDIFKPDGGERRRYQPLWFRTYRYMEITVKTKDEPLVINDLYGYFTAYPFEEVASFKSDNQELNAIWDVGWRTARLCAGETYYDCPYYEQLQYIGDTRIQALISLYVSDDDRLMRNAIEQFYNSQLHLGLTQSRYPAEQPQIIPPFSLFWIGMIHDFWMHRDDLKFIKKYHNGIQNVLYWFQQQIDSNGMLGPMNWWNFVDWSFGPFNGEKPIGGAPEGAMKGYSSIITLQYVYALHRAIDLFEAFGNQYQVSKYQELSKLLMNKTYKLCWDKKRGLMADTPDKTSYSQHANIMVVLTGILSRENSKEFMKKILTEEDLVQTTFYFKFYLIRALVKAGLGNRYLDLLKPWKAMIELGLTTFAEKPEPTRSDCHAWSAHPIYDLLATVCGIRPGSPGFKTVQIEPYLGDLNWVQGHMPHPNGDIFVQFEQKGTKGLKGEIQLPKNVTGNFKWNDKLYTLHSGKQNISL